MTTKYYRAPASTNDTRAAVCYDEEGRMISACLSCSDNTPRLLKGKRGAYVIEGLIEIGFLILC